MIADLCKKWDVLYISDEVYEHMVYKPNKHIRVGKRACSAINMVYSLLFHNKVNTISRTEELNIQTNCTHWIADLIAIQTSCNTSVITY